MKRFALSDIDQEIAATHRLLERVPEEHLDWKPHEKSWTLGELATHTAALLGWQSGILGQDEFDLAQIGPPLESVENRKQLLAMFDETASNLKEAIDAISDDALKEPWTIRNGDQIINRLPTVVALRTTCLSHMIHHRGQLTVYLRLLDVPLPPTYGPTADEEVSWAR